MKQYIPKQLYMVITYMKQYIPEFFRNSGNTDTRFKAINIWHLRPILKNLLLANLMPDREYKSFTVKLTYDKLFQDIHCMLVLEKARGENNDGVSGRKYGVVARCRLWFRI